MKKLTKQNKLHLASRSKYQLKRTGARKSISNSRYFATYTNSPLLYSLNQKERNKENEPITLTAPSNFNLQFENCVEVIRFVNNLKKFARSGRKVIVLDLAHVMDIREGAIAMLLSVMNEIGRSNAVNITGTEPRDALAKSVLEKSGFYKFVNRRSKMTPVKTKNIMRNGVSVTSPNFLSQEVKNSMETVWGEEGRNPVLRTVIFEMMRNSCDHAFSKIKDVSWHLSISHDEEKNLVKFSFVDNGAGIINTLKANALKKVVNLFTGSEDMLDTAFKNGIESRTGLKWRGKGLPSIFESFSDGYIKNLLVISNDVLLHFDHSKKETLPIAYKGTYYYWEIDRDCKQMCFS
jgi:hypothetical protein